jgi:hypothetical protein
MARQGKVNSFAFIAHSTKTEKLSLKKNCSYLTRFTVCAVTVNLLAQPLDQYLHWELIGQEPGSIK